MSKLTKNYLLEPTGKVKMKRSGLRRPRLRMLGHITRLCCDPEMLRVSAGLLHASTLRVIWISRIKELIKKYKEHRNQDLIDRY